MSWKATRTRLAAVAAVACALPAAASPVWDTHAPERAFAFRGQPIDASCVRSIMGPDSKEKTADLARCARRLAREEEEARRKAKIAGDEGDPDAEGQSDYKVQARSGDLFAVDTTFGAGGSGAYAGAEEDFGVSIMRLSKDKLTLVKILGNGDRCTGGATTESVKGAVLRWSENLTPSDVIALGRGKDGLVDGLASGPASCVATRDLEYDLATDKTRWVSLRLTGEDTDVSAKTKLLDESEGGEAHESCFSRLYNSYVRSHRLVLTPAMVTQFAAGFERTCVGKSAR